MTVDPDVPVSRSMPIPVTCRCGKTVQVKDEHAGQSMRCRVCGETMIVTSPLISHGPAAPSPDVTPKIGSDAKTSSRTSFIQWVLWAVVIWSLLTLISDMFASANHHARIYSQRSVAKLHADLDELQKINTEDDRFFLKILISDSTAWIAFVMACAGIAVSQRR